MTDDLAWDRAAEAVRPRPETLSPTTRTRLLAYLTRDDRLYDGSRLRVGTDLKPAGEGCDRATWLRLNGAAADPPQLARRLRYERGRVAQAVFVAALRAAGVEVVDEVACRPLRPSAWAWDAGHGDVLDVAAKHLTEVKCPGVDAWRRATNMPRRLVRESYRYQLSFYFHELKRTGRVETASWLFMDLDGEHDPVEVLLEGDLLVPLAEIVALEASKNWLLDAREAPPRPADTVEIVRVLKGGRGAKRNPKVVAVSRRYWGCGYCDFVGACQPSPDAETPVELAAADPRRVEAVRAAEVEWALEDAEKKAAKQAAAKDNGDAASAPPAATRPLPTPASASGPEPTVAATSTARTLKPIECSCETCGGTRLVGDLPCFDCRDQKSPEAPPPPFPPCPIPPAAVAGSSLIESDDDEEAW
jgi:hypothetical protein